jgi:hypothetical protein
VGADILDRRFSGAGQFFFAFLFSTRVFMDLETHLFPLFCPSPAMAYPATSFIESSYRNDIRTVAAYLEAKHKDHYMVFNLL